MAGDLVAVMDRLGHRSFSVVGHDRGSYVALRLALDHPDRLDRLVVMDGVPICEAVDRCDARFAEAWWHWFFYARPDLPERAVNADPVSWYRLSPDGMDPEHHAELVAAVTDPTTVRAMLEDYRAGLAIDQHHERADRDAGVRVACPTLVLWSSRDDLEELYGDPLEIWRPWTTTLSGRRIDSGHHMAEDNPGDLVAALLDFLPGLAPPRR